MNVEIEKIRATVGFVNSHEIEVLLTEIDRLRRVLDDIVMSPFGIGGHPSAEEAASHMQTTASEALND